MRTRTTTFSAVAAAAIAPILAGLYARGATFDGKFNDNAGGTATASPGTQQAAATTDDPIAKLRGEFAQLQKEDETASKAALAAGKPLTDDEVKASDKRFERMKAIKGLLDDRARFARLQLAGEQSGDGSTQGEPPGRQQFAGQSAVVTGLMPGQRAGENEDAYNKRVRAAINQYIRTGVDQSAQFVITRGTASGSLVPTTIATPVVIKRIANPYRAALAARGLRTISGSSTENISIPFMDDTSNTADEIAENATGDNPKDPTVTGLSLGAKLYDSGTVWFSNSLQLALDFDLYGYVEPRLDERIAQKQTTQWRASILATGVIGKTTASTTGITYAELLAWQKSIAAVLRGTGVFIISDGLQTALQLLTDGAGRLIYQVSARDDAPDTLLGWPVFLDDGLAAPAAGAVSGIAVAADGLHIREVTPTRIVRYVDQPAWPDQFGLRKFTNGDFAFEARAVRLLKHAAA